MKKGEKAVRLVAHVQPTLKRSVQKAAKELGVSESAVVNIALRRYLGSETRRRAAR